MNCSIAVKIFNYFVFVCLSGVLLLISLIPMPGLCQSRSGIMIPSPILYPYTLYPTLQPYPYPIPLPPTIYHYPIPLPTPLPPFRSKLKCHKHRAKVYTLQSFPYFQNKYTNSVRDRELNTIQQVNQQGRVCSKEVLSSSVIVSMRIQNKVNIHIPYSYILTSGVPPGNSVIIQRSTFIHVVYYNKGYIYTTYTHRITRGAPMRFIRTYFRLNL